MKLIRLALVAFMAAAAGAAVAQVQPGGMPGIAVAGSVDDSSMPRDAREFIGKYYPGVAVASVEKNFVRTEYDVRLVNGVEIEFNGKGRVRSIEAPGATVLPDAVVRALLPHKAYKHLSDNGLAGYVEEISIDRRGIEVDLLLENPDDVVYTLTGELVEMD